jgi:hypothetical protein
VWHQTAHITTSYSTVRLIRSVSQSFCRLSHTPQTPYGQRCFPQGHDAFKKPWFHSFVYSHPKVGADTARRPLLRTGRFRSCLLNNPYVTTATLKDHIYATLHQHLSAECVRGVRLKMGFTRKKVNPVVTKPGLHQKRQAFEQQRTTVHPDEVNQGTPSVGHAVR